MIKRRRNVCASGVVIAFPAGLAACGPADPEPAAEPVLETATRVSSAPSVIQVEATDYDFTAPPTFPSGWVTQSYWDLSWP